MSTKQFNPDYYTPKVASELHIDLKTGRWEEKRFPPLSWPFDPTAPRWEFQDGKWVKVLGKNDASK